MKSAGTKFMDGTKLTSVYDLNPVGTIITSMLTEAVFTAETGGTWVLADGRDVSGSRYSTVTGNNTVPDSRGYFLRGLDPTDTVDPNGSTRTLGDTQDDEVTEHSHQLQYRTYGYAGGGGTIHTVNAGQSGLSNTQNTGGAETRPKNMVVNYFIKIN